MGLLQLGGIFRVLTFKVYPSSVEEVFAFLQHLTDLDRIQVSGDSVVRVLAQLVCFVEGTMEMSIKDIFFREP
ncbi:hypothetical protein BH24ACT18_BH24ACT18_00510 [soil metagenome]